MVETIFFGGGTPSLFPAPWFESVLKVINRVLTVAPDVEISMEANPGTVDASHFGDYRLAGINRLSIGVQSFDDSQLKRLGRIHSAKDARRALDSARAAGFENINLDLMYGLPQQTQSDCRQDIDSAIELSPEHLSVYQLTLEPNTYFHKYPPPLPNDDTTWTMQVSIQEALARAGYDQYEVSAYARSGYRCRHNLNYWQFGDYIGVGAGAHGKLSDKQGILRSCKKRHPADYLSASKQKELVDRRWRLGTDDAVLEFMMNALRLNQGIAAEKFSQRTGAPLAGIHSLLVQARQDGLLEPEPQRLRASDKGLRLLNDLLTRFLPEDKKPPATKASLSG